MKSGSIGEIPPSTHGIDGATLLTASDARQVISEKIRHSGSSSKSQWLRLFGSFHSITASIIRSPETRSCVPELRPIRFPAYVHLVLRMRFDGEAGAAQ